MSVGVVDFLKVVDHLFGGDVPAAIVAGIHGRIALHAVQRPAVEELFEAPTIDRLGRIRRERYYDRGLALLARFRVVLGNDRPVVIVNPPRHDATAGAEWAGHAELREDRLADELAFIRKLVQKLRQILFHLEGDDLGFLRLRVFSGHGSLGGIVPASRAYPIFGRPGSQAGESCNGR